MQTASGGAALGTFLDFFRTTGPLIYTSAEDVVNEVTLNTYLLSRICGSSEMEDMIQGGAAARLPIDPSLRLVNRGEWK